MMRGISIFLDDAAPDEAPERPDTSGRGAPKPQTPRERERLAILRRLQAREIDTINAAALLDELERN